MSMKSQELWEHQKLALRYALTSFETEGGYGLFMDMGTGKTRTAIEICRQVYNKEGKRLTTLIVSPLITLRNWKAEFLKFSKATEQDIVILDKSTKSKIKTLQEINTYGRIFITNYNGIIKKDFLEELLKLNPAVTIFDESHRAKNPRSQTTQACIRLTKQSRYTLNLSGTPILNSKLDIFSQMYLLDKGKRFGDNFFRFQRQYFYDKNASMPSHRHFPDWRENPNRSEELKEKINSICFSIKKQECITLPPFVVKDVLIGMSPEQEKAYSEMEETFISFLSSSECTAQLAVVKALRLQQIVSGHLPLDNGSMHNFDNTPREQALEEILSDITPQHKVLVWARFVENYKTIRNVCAKLKIPYVEIHGGISKDNKFKNMDVFNADDSIRVCIGNQSSGGIGVNLTAASYSIYYSRDFSLEADLQSEARNYRAGSDIHEKITRINLITQDTIDELITKSLANKIKISESIFKQYAYKKRKKENPWAK